MKDLERRLTRLENEIAALRTEAEVQRIKDEMLKPPRHVSVMYVTSQHAYDYVDGLGDLQVGDLVDVPTNHYGRQAAVVVSTFPVQNYPGQLLTISKVLRRRFIGRGRAGC